MLFFCAAPNVANWLGESMRNDNVPCTCTSLFLVSFHVWAFVSNIRSPILRKPTTFCVRLWILLRTMSRHMPCQPKNRCTMLIYCCRPTAFMSNRCHATMLQRRRRVNSSCGRVRILKQAILTAPRQREGRLIIWYVGLSCLISMLLLVLWYVSFWRHLFNLLRIALLPHVTTNLRSSLLYCWYRFKYIYIYTYNFGCYIDMYTK